MGASFSEADAMPSLYLRYHSAWFAQICFIFSIISFNAVARPSTASTSINGTCWIYEYEFRDSRAEKSICFKQKNVAEIFTYASRHASSFDTKWMIHKNKKLEIESQICDFSVISPDKLDISGCWYEGSYRKVGPSNKK